MICQNLGSARDDTPDSGFYNNKRLRDLDSEYCELTHATYVLFFCAAISAIWLYKVMRVCVICMEKTEEKWEDCPNKCSVHVHVECLKQWKTKSGGRCLICKDRNSKNGTISISYHGNYRDILSFLLVVAFISYTTLICMFTVWFIVLIILW